ncbi:MAG: hypothetical protein M3M85_03000 [bacterium]|nr:hypothetical protein [bacterium]
MPSIDVQQVSEHLYATIYRFAVIGVQPKDMSNLLLAAAKEDPIPRLQASGEPSDLGEPSRRRKKSMRRWARYVANKIVERYPSLADLYQAYALIEEAMNSQDIGNAD